MKTTYLTLPARPALLDLVENFTKKNSHLPTEVFNDKLHSALLHEFLMNENVDFDDSVDRKLDDSDTVGAMCVRVDYDANYTPEEGAEPLAREDFARSGFVWEVIHEPRYFRANEGVDHIRVTFRVPGSDVSKTYWPAERF